MNTNFELDSIEINKLPVIDITGDEILDEVIDIDLIFNYQNPKSDLDIDRIRVCLRQMSPQTRATFMNFINQALQDVQAIFGKEFKK
ncbi:MAG TPA: hypothetical protein VK190_02910 [Pseudoneobacillus sp.]|nr:hypothetical protein [Pseudoneobacillus sp.]